MNEDLITFEQDLARIEDIVNQLSAGTVGLNDAVALYEESVARLRHARDLLDKAELRVICLSTENNNKGEDSVELSGKD